MFTKLMGAVTHGCKQVFVMDKVPEIHDKESQSLWETLCGDKSAFDEIVVRYNPSLFRFSCFYLGDMEEARDACQEIFLKVYLNMNRFRYEKPFKPWFYSIALNHLKRKYTQMKKKKKMELLFPDCFLDCVKKDIVQDMVDQCLCLEVRKAIDELPPDLETCTRLYYLDEFHIDEICNELDLGKENVKSRLFRARKILKKTLHDTFDQV